MSPQPLDRDAVEKLATTLIRSVRDHYLERPTSKATAQEAINAIAIALAFIIAGARACGGEAEARELFELALEIQLDDINTPTTLGELQRWLS